MVVQRTRPEVDDDGMGVYSIAVGSTVSCPLCRWAEATLELACSLGLAKQQFRQRADLRLHDRAGRMQACSRGHAGLGGLHLPSCISCQTKVASPRRSKMLRPPSHSLRVSLTFVSSTTVQQLAWVEGMASLEAQA